MPTRLASKPFRLAELSRLTAALLSITLLTGGTDRQCNGQSRADRASEKASQVDAHDVRSILRAHCFDCHGPERQNGDVRLDQLSTDLVHDRRGSDTWHDALNALQRGDMPPAEAPALSREQRSTLVDWIRGELTRAERSRRQTGGQVVMRRLNRFEYQNTMRDLIGLDLTYGADLPPDPVGPDGFTNNGESLKMAAMQLEMYLRSARRALSHAIVEGPAPKVIESHFTETVADKGKGNWTNRLGRSGQFVVRIPEFPDEGEFVIRIKARAELPGESPYGQLQVTLGYRADVSAPSRVVGTVDVANEETQEYVFRGRLEEFPIQSRTQSKYPGMLLWLQNIYSDGQSPSPPRTVVEPATKGKKKRKTLVYPEDPTFPKIVVESVDFKAPNFLHWPPSHHQQIISETPATEDDEYHVAKQSLSAFVEQAFRRPIADSETDRFLKYFKSIRPAAPSFEAAMRETLSMVLISPEFLYLSEPQGDGRPLTDSELAARLSYFLWSSKPDDRLMQVASSGGLSGADRLRAEVDRMLTDERSTALATQFGAQWLDAAGVDRVAVNPEFYPNFDPSIKAEMRKEPAALFDFLLRNDLSALNLLDSDFVVVNESLARYYGLKGPRGSEFERVTLPADSLRGGVLTQGAMLLANSTGEDSHPIKRAVWIRQRLLDDPPPPPPPDVPDLNQELPDLAALPLKAQLVQHRENEACAACHRDIDPWGITLDQFDATGMPREVIRRKHPRRRGKFVEHAVDALGRLPDGTELDGVDELKSYLVKSRCNEFARAFVTKLLAYALGRSLELGDMKLVDELTGQFVASGYKIAPLVQLIVHSDSFREG